MKNLIDIVLFFLECALRLFVFMSVPTMLVVLAYILVYASLK